MKKLNILVIPSWYPNKKDPLWGNYFIKQAEALNSFANISFLHINRLGIKNVKDIIKEKKTDGLDNSKYSFKFYKKTILNLKSINLDYAYKMYAKKAYKAYLKFKKEVGNIDIILVDSIMPAGLAAKYISDKENIPYIVYAHSMDVLNNPYYKKYCDEIIKDADGYMAVSTPLLNYINDRRSDCHLIPNFIDCKKFDVERKEHDTFTFVNICNFYKVKALEVLLKAIEKVVNEKKIKNIKLKIVGTGAYKEFYESVAKSLDITDYVEFIGYVKNDDIPEVLSECDALCVSSIYETFCIPIVEAFSAGLPVITTDCGGPTEIVNKDNALVVPVGDIDKYADALEEMINNYDKYDKDKIKEYVFNKYDKDIISKKIIKICEEVINGKYK